MSARRHHRYPLFVGLFLIISGLPLAIYLLRTPAGAQASWWTGNGGTWSKRQQLTITNSNPSASLATNTTIAVTVNTKDLVAIGKLKSNCDDLRIVFQPNSSLSTELDRFLSYPGGGSCANSEATKVYFKLQNNLNAGISSSNYYLYYGNSSAAAPAAPDNTYDLGSNNARLVCPFDGSTTCAAGQTPSTAGAIRYTGSKSGLYFNGNNNYLDAGHPSTLNNLTTTTVEMWYRLASANFSNVSQEFLHKSDYFSISLSNMFGETWISSSMGFSLQAAYSRTSANTLPLDTNWHHLAVTFNDQGDRKLHIFLDGTELAYQSQTAAQGTRNDESGYSLLFGKNLWSSDLGFYGYLDEVRISDSVRYTSIFTPQTIPFIRDNHTLLLYHLDENGNDPRNSGKVTDDSGNGNTGTLYGPVFVGGLTGIDSSTTETGHQAGGHTYVGHEGLFLEESTNNKITNPSFEHSTYTTNWSASASAILSKITSLPKFGTNAAGVDTRLTGNLGPFPDYRHLYDDTSRKRLAQGFQIGSPGSPTTAVIYALPWGTSSNYYHLEIQTDASGLPSNTPVTNGTSNCVAFSSITGQDSFTFSPAPSLSATTQYHLVLRAFTDSGCTSEQASPDNSNFIWWEAQNPGTYSSGTMEAYTDGGSWASVSGIDFGFYLYDSTQNSSLLTTVNVGDTNQQTLSAYVYNEISPAGGPINNSIANLMFNATPVATTYTNMGGGWWRLSATAAGINGNANYGVRVKPGQFVYIDGVQLEEKYGITSFCDGSLGTGYAWDTPAQPNNSSSTRTEASATYTNALNQNDSSGSISLWVKPNWDGTANPYIGASNYYRFTYARIGEGGYGFGNGFILRSACGEDPCTNSNNFTVESYTSEFSCDRSISLTINRNTWYHLVYTFNGTTATIYVNGTNSDSGACSTLTTDSGTVRLGTWTYAGNPDATVSDLRVYDDPLTADQVAGLYAAGLVSHSQGSEIDRFSASKGANPAAVWHFDEGYGLIAHDATTNARELTINGATWNVEPQSIRSNLSRNLKFNGTSGTASRSGTLSTGFNFGTGEFTLGGWFKHDATITGTDTLISKYSTAGYKVYLNSNGFLCFGVDDDSSWGPDDEICSNHQGNSHNLADGQWHQFSAVKTGVDSLELYLDGQSVGTRTSLTAQGSLDNTANFVVGAETGTNFWDGNLDEIYVYPYARTADQVKTDYFGPQTGSALGATTVDSSTGGLIGHWSMDEGAANTCSGGSNDACDSSGNHRDGAWNGNATNTVGKFGNGVTLDGTGDYLSVPTFGL